MDSSINFISTPEIDPKKIDLLWSVENNLPPVRNEEFVTKEKSEQLAKIFRLTTFKNVKKDWKLK